jgi:hypothetical protein
VEKEGCPHLKRSEGECGELQLLALEVEMVAECSCKGRWEAFNILPYRFDIKVEAMVVIELEDWGMMQLELE